jgi:miniconductance mechanosensitive channel
MLDTAIPSRHLSQLQQTLAPYPWAYDALVLAGVVLLAWLANWLTKRVLLRGLQSLLNRLTGGGAQHDQGVRMRVVPRLANVVPALVLAAGVGAAPHLPGAAVEVVQKLCHAFIVLTVALSVSRALDVINHAYERRADARNRPIKGYLQVAKIIMFVLVGLSIVATLSGVKFVHVVTGLGAMTAVLILVFQDTLLSLVASVQISNDGRLRMGDWIEMPSQNADGDVVDIALHTVTVQNWDKTITTIPTKKLISDSFKNWRGMQESGGRRIKRALYLDQHSVRFLDEGEIDQLRQVEVLGAYIDAKRSELAQWNAQLSARGLAKVNARRITNIGTFRAYVEQYLRAHPHVHQSMTLLVRQLQPTTTGLPLEIYCFSNDTRWAMYEQIQSDIFDHLLATLPLFDLRVFQESSDAMLMAGARVQAAAVEGVAAPA